MKRIVPVQVTRAFSTLRSQRWLTPVLVLLGAGLAGWLVSLAAYPAPLVTKEQGVALVIGLPQPEAEKALRSAEKHVEAGGDFLHQLAIAVLEQGKLEEAEEIAADFLRAYPSDARARSLFGEIYLSRRQLEAARASHPGAAHGSQ